jgi:predicted Zn-dependent protease
MTRTKKRMCVNIVISGFSHGINEIFTVPGGYISYISSSLLTFWDDLSAHLHWSVGHLTFKNGIDRGF